MKAMGERETGVKAKGTKVSGVRATGAPGGDVTLYSHLCSRKHPLQTCSGICGVSVIISASLAC